MSDVETPFVVENIACLMFPLQTYLICFSFSTTSSGTDSEALEAVPNFVPGTVLGIAPSVA